MARRWTTPGIPVYYVDAGHTVSYESHPSRRPKRSLNAFGDGYRGRARRCSPRFDELEARLDSVSARSCAGMNGDGACSPRRPPTTSRRPNGGTLGSMAAMMGLGQRL